MLATRELTYRDLAATRPEDEVWGAPAAGYRSFEATTVIGHGHPAWDAARRAVLEWGVKTRSGFRVVPDGAAALQVTDGADYWLSASVGPVTVREPVRVVAVVDRPDRCGFAYGTLAGHPVSGEEAFILSRTPDGDVVLTLRSLTRPAPGGAWRAAFPVLLVAQRIYRRRYLRALAGS